MSWRQNEVQANGSCSKAKRTRAASSRPQSHQSELAATKYFTSSFARNLSETIFFSRTGAKSCLFNCRISWRIRAGGKGAKGIMLLRAHGFQINVCVSSVSPTCSEISTSCSSTTYRSQNLLNTALYYLNLYVLVCFIESKQHWSLWCISEMQTCALN